MKCALAHAQVQPGQIDVICASANGLEALDQHERLAFDDVFAGSGMLPAVCAIKALLGESLGAAGALQCAVMIEAIRRGTIPAVCGWAQDGRTAESVAPGDVRSTRTVRLCLINALSIDGHASSLVLAI
jgi:3-oxoacyl-(acyl-carrier-protein) synthase